jgi:hypothetical protein
VLTSGGDLASPAIATLVARNGADVTVVQTATAYGPAVRAGDAITAAHQRLPMVEVHAYLALTGRPRGQSACSTHSEGRRQLGASAA